MIRDGKSAGKDFSGIQQKDSQSFKRFQDSRSGRDIDVEWLGKIRTEIDN